MLDIQVEFRWLECHMYEVIKDCQLMLKTVVLQQSSCRHDQVHCGIQILTLTMVIMAVINIFVITYIALPLPIILILH
jgi:hypothetical protein